MPTPSLSHCWLTPLSHEEPRPPGERRIVGRFIFCIVAAPLQELHLERQAPEPSQSGLWAKGEQTEKARNPLHRLSKNGAASASAACLHARCDTTNLNSGACSEKVAGALSWLRWTSSAPAVLQEPR